MLLMANLHILGCATLVSMARQYITGGIPGHSHATLGIDYCICRPAFEVNGRARDNII